MIMSDIGPALAIAGSIVSIIGVWQNNIQHDHHGAMVTWGISNPVLLLWAIGMSQGWWNGGLSGMALAGLYGVFTVTNVYGLVK